MKKRTILTALLITMLLSMSLMFTGCGSEPATLEDWIASDSEAAASIEDLNSDSLQVAVEGNTVVYTYTYPQEIDASLVDAVAEQLESTIDGSASTFTSMADTLSEESGIEDISIQVIYLDSAGTELLNKTY